MAKIVLHVARTSPRAAPWACPRWHGPDLDACLGHAREWSCASGRTTCTNTAGPAAAGLSSLVQAPPCR
eukprot:scaffold5858_cov202-Prasinococcus_capsulatus_cf.AAC.1